MAGRIESLFVFTSKAGRFGLSEEALRFNQLRREIAEIPPKALSQILKHLDCDGRIYRETSHDSSRSRIFRLGAGQDVVQSQAYSAKKMALQAQTNDGAADHDERRRAHVFVVKFRTSLFRPL